MDKMDPPDTSSYSYEPFNCYCPHSSSQHALMRCGHPNDRPPTHTLYKADDAFHRIWCMECKKWCFSKRDDCPLLKNPGMHLGSGGRSGNGGASTTERRVKGNACARM
ncbi:hypothetical protein P691DRAFT_373563 [Macrolepiota fuliginosa MF-IS2]|uniref:Uncharacterized protein n=1 Tax=Macrolepiota fuliginosa MF-IS2 TaxID=1400762 RepID=A0A9P5XIH0_9AGAR|nr:hypothetical protein P691DRAFT_373563 [Macrolepiota fuliginosa MF-IS2]